MDMFCYQCQETAKNEGCTVKGVCGKEPKTANLQDLLIYLLKGISIYTTKAKELEVKTLKADEFVMESLFMTITNANFDDTAFIEQIKEGLDLRDKIRAKAEEAGANFDDNKLYEGATWRAETEAEFITKANEVGVLQTEDEDVRSLRELITYGIKGMAAYTEHAYNLGYEKQELYDFMQEALVATTDDNLSADELVELTLETGKFGVEAMKQLDEANTERYGDPEITEVEIGTRDNPAILISGHDLKDMEQLLKQTAGTGVDVYTHSEMLPANYYPAFKKYDHFVGNYGNAWWQQKEEFEKFNGPILFTTNCIVPPKSDASYKDKIFTTGAAGLEGATHIEADENGDKNFREIIELAKECDAPEQIEEGTIVGGFAHNQVMELADKVVEAVKEGAIKEFFVMAGCDGRMNSREYYTEFAKELPEDTVILTAGCAKYRYNKLDLGDIDGIPRVLDAGQCNDSYSLAVIAMKLQEVFELDDINELPISYNVAWYEQKAVIVLLSLLYLGVKDIKLGPTLPAFLSENVASVLVDKFGISGIEEVETDIDEFLSA
ncbi:hydroxylamine reductase [Halobacteroides halobius DSM 5150]|uniref:Hydroxylamine reductase n=1 Tax=Halobacteroides halobius (strain ATCC 35273 / DSM 5150 / MD-1) TaxID=748449 RepID=L0K5X5_HALHC|nr:hydroxylamine reductase [Halobacteroides halobius]AGB40406.1 hydroxylamine reductase [Halobacteroides halobius DSM 5150]